MKTVELWRWRVADPVRPGRTYVTRYVMTEEQALAKCPTAERVPGSLERRQVADSDIEIAARSHSIP